MILHNIRKSFLGLANEIAHTEKFGDHVELGLAVILDLNKLSALQSSRKQRGLQPAPACHGQ